MSFSVGLNLHRQLSVDLHEHFEKPESIRSMFAATASGNVINIDMSAPRSSAGESVHDSASLQQPSEASADEAPRRLSPFSSGECRSLGASSTAATTAQSSEVHRSHTLANAIGFGGSAFSAAAFKAPVHDSLSSLPRTVQPSDKITDCSATSSDCDPSQATRCPHGTTPSLAIGSKALTGGRPNMEDAHYAQPNFVVLRAPPCGLRVVPSCLKDELDLAIPSAYESGQSTDSDTSNSSYNSDEFHYAGVFDGHGGDGAARFCQEELHMRLLRRLGQNDLLVFDGACDDCGNKPTALHMGEGSAAVTGGRLEIVQPRTPHQFHATDSNVTASSAASAPTSVMSSGEDDGMASADMPCSFTQKVIESLAGVFQEMDEEFGLAQNAGATGTTALVALVGSRQMFVAHCGDSRAVLCRNGKAVPLTSDHKPERSDELARVQNAGGKVLNCNGQRVMGVLAMSRAIGDHCLRPFVIANPEVTSIPRLWCDELLVLATDGLWDVVSNQEAVNLAQRGIARAVERGAPRHKACRVAASVLARAASERGSRDNITVVVLDLQADAPRPSLAPSARTATAPPGAFSMFAQHA